MLSTRRGMDKKRHRDVMQKDSSVGKESKKERGESEKEKQRESEKKKESRTQRERE